MKVSNGKQSSTMNYTSNISLIYQSRETRVADNGKLRRGRRRRKTSDADMAAGARCRRRGLGESGCATPLSKWKFHDGDGGLSVPGGEAPVTGGRWVRRVKGDDVVLVSGRKLTAALWRLAVPVTSAGGGGGVRWQCRPLDWCRVELHSSLQIPKSAMEGAVKWDTSYSKLSSEVQHFCSPLKPNENQQIATISVASALQVQLVHAQKRIEELETDRWLSKKKLKHFLRKLSEERASWKSREHQKVPAAIDDMKDALKRERRNCRSIYIANSKLLNDLTDAKLLAKLLVQKYEKERKTRVLIEDLCGRLAKEIEADKSEIEALKSQCSRIREEVEAERKMLQLAEVWREERVQMKLVDAILILEKKFCQLNNLVGDLEIFLRSRNIALNMKSEAKMIRQVIESMDVQDINEFSYVPPKSVIIEDLKGDEAEDGKIDQCLGRSSASNTSEIQSGSPEINGIIRNTVQEHPNSSTTFDRTFGDASSRETKTCAENQYSSCTFAESERYVNGINRGEHIASGRTEQESNADHKSLNSQTSEISSVSVKQPRRKGTSDYKLLRSLPTNNDVCKTISADANHSLSNTSTSNITTSPGRVSVEGSLQHNDLRVQWSSPGARNPHIARAMKGCIEWPRGIQRSGLKTKLLEARLAGQRTQLRSILKQRN